MKQYTVTGMSCAACSARVEKAVSRVPGVTSCSVSLLTNSMGVEGDVSAQEIIKAVEDAWDSGLVVCAAAGNQGPARSSITVPGTSPKVITVGASDDSRAVRFPGARKANYSGRGPTAACVCKPDVTAPGAYIKSCSADFEKKGRSFYTEKSGTSMATPVVSGSLALLLSRNRKLTNKQVKLALRASCLDLGLPRNQQGWGQIWIPELLRGE